MKEYLRNGVSLRPVHSGGGGWGGDKSRWMKAVTPVKSQMIMREISLDEGCDPGESLR